MDSDTDEMRVVLARNWGLTAESPTAPTDRSALLEALAGRVRHLLRRDFERLVTAMYSLDVNESQFREAVEGDETAAARRVAELILEREFAKMRSRKRYASEDAGRRLPPL